MPKGIEQIAADFWKFATGTTDELAERAVGARASGVFIALYAGETALSVFGLNDGKYAELAVPMADYAVRAVRMFLPVGYHNSLQPGIVGTAREIAGGLARWVLDSYDSPNSSQTQK